MSSDPVEKLVSFIHLPTTDFFIMNCSGTQAVSQAAGEPSPPVIISLIALLLTWIITTASSDADASLVS